MNFKDEMNIKIQRASTDGLSNNKGKCDALAKYLTHEDQERIDAGKESLPFLTPEGIPVTMEEVIEKINGNHQHLGKDDDKFYHLVAAPSESEIQAMGETEHEIYKSGKILMRAILDAYAENFHREGVEDASDLVVFWKPHFTRGENGDLQFHLHAIISRNSKGLDGKKKKISPLTTHRNTENGPVKGGFDRDAFFRNSERIFDKLFAYERQVAESYDYSNAMAHGTAEQKAEQIERLHKEGEADLAAQIHAGITRRREAVQTKNDIVELTELLSSPQAELPESQEDTLGEALHIADMNNLLTRIFSEAHNLDELHFNLLLEGLVGKPVFGHNGGVEDIQLSKNGTVYTTSSFLAPEKQKSVLDNWWRLARQKPAYVIRAEQAKKEIAQHIEKLAPSKGRGIH